MLPKEGETHRHTRALRIAIVAASLVGWSLPPSVIAAQAPRGGVSAAASSAATLPDGFTESIAFSGLTNPTSFRFSPDGRVFVAEKSGLIKVFDSLTDATPTIFADLRTQVDDYWDRGLLGMTLDPGFPAKPDIYVLYAYDALIGGTAPLWNDACPAPPGPTTDGCVISGRLSRLHATGDVMSGPEEVLINDWCQQYPSHSVGDLRFGPDGMLYASAGDGASFTFADFGQGGGSAGSPTPKNPCGDPPTGVGGTQTVPTAEGGALRAQDLRTMQANGAYATVVRNDGPVAYWRLGESSGTTAIDELGTSTGTYRGGFTLGVTGAIAGDPNTAATLNGTTSFVRIPDSAAVRLANGPFSIEAWVKRRTGGAPRAIIGKGANGYYLFVNSSGRVVLAKTTVADIATSTIALPSNGWAHVVATKNGASTHLYVNGVDVTGAVADQSIANNNVAVGLGSDNGNKASFIFDGDLDEVALYKKVLTAGQVQTHYSAGIGGGVPDPVGLNGAILRLDPATGAAAAGNPLVANADLNARRIVADGFRNPFRFTFRPGTNELWVGDVGWATWEEINRITSPTSAIRDYGWPCYEGAGQQASYAPANICQGLYGDSVNPASGPYYAYNSAANVVAGETCPTGSSSITGIAFYTGGTYPSTYADALFFADHSRNCIWAMLKGANGLPDPASIQVLVADAANPVDLEIGPGGDLFYVDFDGGSIRRLQFLGSNNPPVAVAAADPTSGPAPLTVQFDATGSSDPDAGDTLTYAWDLDDDGAYNDSTIVSPSWTYTATGTVIARLRVTDNDGASSTAQVTINVGQVPNNPPMPVIDTPASSLTWAVGDLISFSGHATDTEDGNEPATRLSWQLIMHHCPSNCHTHDVQSWTGVANGSLTAPDHDYPSFLELKLTATDSVGVQASTSVNLDPRTVALTFATVPTGLQLVVGASAGTAPFTRTVIVNSQNSISAPSPQVLGGQSNTFSSWSDGGAATHTIIAPPSTTTYTATFTTSAAVSYSSVVRNDGPVAYWRLGDPTGVVATDELGASGGWYGGSVTRGITGAIAGDPNTAVSLNGTSESYVGVPSYAVLNLADGPFSVEFWVKRNSATGAQPIIDRGPGSYQIMFSASTNKMTLFRNGGGTIAAEQTATTDTSTWHHYVVAKVGSTVKIYRDGVDVTGPVTNLTLSNSSSNLWFGRWNDGTTFGDLQLDEVAIYSKVLTAQQVLAHRNAGAGG